MEKFLYMWTTFHWTLILQLEPSFKLYAVQQILYFVLQGSTSLCAQQQQLQQLQLLQQQLIQHTQLMQQSNQGTPVIDNTLLSSIQTLTNQLLKSGDKPAEPGFNRVRQTTYISNICTVLDFWNCLKISRCQSWLLVKMLMFNIWFSETSRFWLWRKWWWRCRPWVSYWKYNLCQPHLNHLWKQMHLTKHLYCMYYMYIY